jgi:hypothetical protein
MTLKLSIAFSVLAICGLAQADCTSSLPLKGSLAVDNCDPSRERCTTSSDALYQYMSARKDDDPEVLYVGLHGSPWHVYDGDYHIIEVDELADMVRRQGSAIKRVVLLSSWSGVAPNPNGKSVAQRLSHALNGMPVSGMDGFIWFNRDGSIQTTHQAMTAVRGGQYWVADGGKVMASLVAGWPVALAAEFSKSGDASGLMRAGAGYDIYLLCPSQALKTFDASAAMADPIAAYNAAILRLERNAAGDKQAALTLLKKSASLGDQKAQLKLKSLAGTSTQ